MMRCLERLVSSAFGSERETKNGKLLALTVVNAFPESRLTGQTRFQKCVYFVQKEEIGTTVYDYTVEDYGPFSQELYADVQKLVACDFLNAIEETTQLGNTRTVYAMTDKGNRAIKNSPTSAFPYTEQTVQENIDKHKDKTVWDILDYLSNEYPRTMRNTESW